MTKRGGRALKFDPGLCCAQVQFVVHRACRARHFNHRCQASSHAVESMATEYMGERERARGGFEYSPNSCLLQLHACLPVGCQANNYAHLKQCFAPSWLGEPTARAASTKYYANTSWTHRASEPVTHLHRASCCSQRSR